MKNVQKIVPVEDANSWLEDGWIIQNVHQGACLEQIHSMLPGPSSANPSSFDTGPVSTTTGHVVERLWVQIAKGQDEIVSEVRAERDAMVSERNDALAAAEGARAAADKFASELDGSGRREAHANERAEEARVDRIESQEKLRAIRGEHAAMRKHIGEAAYAEIAKKDGQR